MRSHLYSNVHTTGIHQGESSVRGGHGGGGVRHEATKMARSSVRRHIPFSGRLHLPLTHAQNITRVLQISLQRMHMSCHDTHSAVWEQPTFLATPPKPW